MTTRRNRRVQTQPLLNEEERVYTEDDYASPDAQGLSYGEVSYAEQMDWLPSFTQEEISVPDGTRPITPAAAGVSFTQDWSAAPEEDANDEFLPDLEETEYVPFQLEGYQQGYDPAYDSEVDFIDDDDLLTEEEQAELRRSQWQLLANLADMAGIILGVALILLLMMLLISLLNWLSSDLTQSFTLLQKNF